MSRTGLLTCKTWEYYVSLILIQVVHKIKDTGLCSEKNQLHFFTTEICPWIQENCNIDPLLQPAAFTKIITYYVVKINPVFYV
jgi:hypothetical protein